MKTLHLHIGFCKTGTTSIQHVLYQNKLLLQNHNFSLFCTNFYGKECHSGRAELWTPFGPKGKEDYKNTAQRLAKEMAQSPCDNVILTEEAFSVAFDQNTLETLYSALKKHFDTIKIYVYIRRQDRYAVSYLQEASKRISPILGLQECAGRALPLENTLNTKSLTKEIIFDEHIEFTNYLEILSMWANIFGKENMHIGVFEKSQLKNGSIITDFLSHLSLETKITVAAEPHLAQSKGFEYTKVGHLILQSNLDQRMGDFVRKYLDNTGKSLPSREDAQKFYAPFKEMNKELNEKFHISSQNDAIFDDDFSDYPEESQDLWTEESANQAILNLFNAFTGMIELVASQVYEQVTAKHLEEIQAYKKKLREIAQGSKNIVD